MVVILKSEFSKQIQYKLVPATLIILPKFEDVPLVEFTDTLYLLVWWVELL